MCCLASIFFRSVVGVLLDERAVSAEVDGPGASYDGNRVSVAAAVSATWSTS